MPFLGNDSRPLNKTNTAPLEPYILWGFRETLKWIKGRPFQMVPRDREKMKLGFLKYSDR